MMRACTRVCAALCAAGAIALSPLSLASTGGEEPMPEFNSPWGPVRPITSLATGSLGVVESTWWRKPLLLAWYRFNGQPLPSTVLNAFSYEADSKLASDKPQGMDAWLLEAGRVVPAIAPQRVAAETPSVTGNRWDQIENCPADAWEQARRTLAERLQAWGSESPALRNWLEAQHRVFARCPLGPAYFRKDLPGGGQINEQYAKAFILPDMALPALSPDAPPLLAKDRAYQSAAALLYEGRYAEAESAFSAIARDESSPWREWGMYLAFRARLRHIQLTQPNEAVGDGCQTPECLARRAETQKNRAAEARRLREAVQGAMAASSKAGKADEARRLADLDALIAARLDPARRFVELAAVLKNPDVEAAAFRRAVTDYLLLHRQFPPSEPMGEWLAGLVLGYDPTRQPCQIGQGAAKPPSDFPDLAETECRRQQWSVESLRRHEQAPAQAAWLFSAASLARRSDPHVARLLLALRSMPDDHPGAASFMLQRVRLGEREESLRLAAALLTRAEITADYSARNRVHEYRLWHAASLADFCRDAPREYGRAFDRDTLLQAAPPDPTVEPARGWDSDGAWILNYELPHAALIEVAQRADCLSSIRSTAITMAWSRAILQKDVSAAREALALMAKARGAPLPPQMSRMQTIQDDRSFLLEGGLAIEGARTGGTCRIAAPKADAYTPDYEESVGNLPQSFGRFAKNLLSPARFAAWQRERKALDALPDLDSAWMQNVLAFSEAFPKDERVPGLLRDAVYRTRLNWCADPSAGNLSKAAFELLKRRYPKSKEAVSTKYWFKPRT